MRGKYKDFSPVPYEPDIAIYGDPTRFTMTKLTRQVTHFRRWLMLEQIHSVARHLAFN